MQLETSQLDCDVTGGIVGKIKAAINIVLAVPGVRVYFCSSFNPDSKYNLLGTATFLYRSYSFLIYLLCRQQSGRNCDGTERPMRSDYVQLTFTFEQ